jgi:hypothetical protein
MTRQSMFRLSDEPVAIYRENVSDERRCIERVFDKEIKNLKNGDKECDGIFKYIIHDDIAIHLIFTDDEIKKGFARRGIMIH